MSLFGLGMGSVFPIFHMRGMLFVFSTVLKRWVRCSSALGPRCLRCLMLMLSGPVELLFLCCLSAACVCATVMCMYVLFSFLTRRSVCLFVALVWCVTLFVNCLLKRCAFCLCVMAVLLLNVIVLFGFGVVETCDSVP